MTNHLPECQYGLDYPCICDRLRACEQRVTARFMDDKDHYRVLRDYWLDAAREAIEASPVAIREPGVILLNREVVIAAIDALEGDGDDDQTMGTR